MTDVIVPFVTGLTTGGLSCLAVQGGLLATSIAHQTETESQQELAAKRAAKAARPRARPASITTASQTPASNHTTKPILIFSGTKLVVYTILGAMLGALGSVLQLTPTPFLCRRAAKSGHTLHPQGGEEQ